MRIVQIEDDFHPDAGYQINILSKYFVQFGHEVTIIAAEPDILPDSLTAFFGKDNIPERDAAYTADYGVKIKRIPAKNYISGRVIFDRRVLMQAILEEAPDVIFAHGNDTFTSMQIFWNRRRFDCPIISDSHMVDQASNNKLRSAFRLFYRCFVTPILEREKIPVVRTADDAYVNRRLGIPEALTPLITFGSDTLLFHPDTEARRQFRVEHDIDEDAFVLLYCGKLGAEKGGDLLAELCQRKLNTEKKPVFLIIGNAPGGDYGSALEQSFRNSAYPLLRFPTQKYPNLAPFYQAADLALIPRQCSLSLYDMQACGLPVLAEDNSTNQWRLSFSNGWVFKSGDLNAFQAKLEEILQMPDYEFSAVKENALRMILSDYNYEEKARAFEHVLVDACEAYKRRRK